MIDLRTPKYQWGQRVVALSPLANDGSYPDQPDQAVLVTEGACGEIVNVGHHTEANIPVYMVDFDGRVVGCFEEEIALVAAQAA